MALQWKFNEDFMGTLKTERVTTNIYNGNAFALGLTETDKHYYLHWFFADETHCKRCLGITKGYTENMYEYDWNGAVLTLNPKKRGAKKFAELMLKAFDKITIVFDEDVEKYYYENKEEC